MMYMASVSTPHFDFTAFGGTEQEAVKTLMDAWKRHAEETGAREDYVDEGDVNVLPFQLGKAYRDYTEI